MSLRSFIENCRKYPNYGFKRLNWDVLLKLQGERELVCDSACGSFRISSKDQIIGRALYLTGDFCMSDIKQACDLLVKKGKLKAKGNGTLFDIGANIGTVCIPLLRQGTFDKAVCFEPEPKNVGLLERNIRLNGLEARTDIHSIALSATDEQMTMQLSSINFGDHRVRAAAASDASEAHHGRVSIQARSLDSLVAESAIDAERVSLIWMDTQGHESAILEGGRKFFARKIPMVTEYWPHGLRESGSSGQEYAGRLREFYDFFIDLRDKDPQEYPTTELRTRLERYEGGADRYADLLLY